MKLIRFGAPAAEKPGLLLPDGSRRDVSGIVRDFDEAFFAGNGLERLAEATRGRERLLPGDVISTGTPAGVGMATGDYLKPGDTVEWGADGLGAARHTARAWGV